MNISAHQLRSGLSNDEFVPHFQPIVRLRTGDVAGVEVLARWLSPTLGNVPPALFVGRAEQEGLIDDLTVRIIEKAFTAGHALPAGQWMAVNISPCLLLDSSLPGRLRESAERTGFPLNRVVIEITESALLDNMEHAQMIVTELKGEGCRLALDDFGTGYSSLLHLHALPFDELKVDRTFIASMQERRESRKIVSAVVGLGQSLGMGTIAEGVETTEQAEILVLLGCEMAQGWLFGKPLSADALSSMAAPPLSRAFTRSASSIWPEVSYNSPPDQRLAQLRALYEGAPVGLAFLDRDLRYISINEELAKMNGIPVGAHHGRLVSELLPDIYQQLELNLLQAVTGYSVCSSEVVRLTTDGSSELGFLVSYLPTLDEAGEVIGVSVAVVDITSRKRAEAALRESEDHYRHMVELNPQIPWVLDENGMAIMISPRWQQLTGMSEEEYRGRGFLDALHPSDRVRIEATIESAMSSGDPIDVECRARTVSGEWRWIRSRGSPRRDSTGRIIRWYGSVDDIDDQKRLEQKLCRQAAGPSRGDEAGRFQGIDAEDSRRMLPNTR